MSRLPRSVPGVVHMKSSKKETTLKEFRTWLMRSRSKKTTDLYYHRARAFLDWAGQRKITGKLLDQYISELTDEGKSQNTLATYYMNLRAFYRFLGLERELDDVEAPRFTETEINCPSIEDINLMLEQASKPLERALLSLQFGAGLRVTELRRLKRDDLVIHDDGSGEIVVRSAKTRAKVQDVRVPIGASVVGDVTAYLNSREDDLDPMFPSEQAADGMITEMTVNNNLKRLCKRAGVEAITSHQLRHALTTWLLQQGVSRDDVMKICRWRSERSIRRYDHLVPSEIRSRIPDPFAEGDEEDERCEPDHDEG